MLHAIALTEVWDDANEKTIKEGEEFSMTDDRIQSLVNIGAAKLKPVSPVPEEVKQEGK
jgi:hypothetical protein